MARKDYSSRDHVGVVLTTIGTPVNPTDAVTKAYDDLKLPLTGGTIVGLLTVDNFISNNTATTKGVQYHQDEVWMTGADQYHRNIRWTGPDAVIAVTDTGNFALQTADGGTYRSLQINNLTASSGTVTTFTVGTLSVLTAVTVPAPTAATHATTKQYVDIDNTTRLKVTGGTMTGGDLTLFRDPTTAMHATTKQYVDSKSGLTQSAADTLYVNASGDSMSGPLTLDPGWWVASDAIRVTRIDTLGAGTTVWVNAILEMGGARIINVATPTGAQDATNKTYVDNKIYIGTVSPTDPTVEIWIDEGSNYP